MEGAERELPLLRCVVFDGDEIASRVVGGIENVEKVSVNSITEMEDVVKRGGFVAVVHVGARLNSAEMARIVNAACEHGTRLGFLVFPMGMERKMRMSSFGSPAILVQIGSVNVAFQLAFPHFRCCRDVVG